MEKAREEARFFFPSSFFMVPACEEKKRERAKALRKKKRDRQRPFFEKKRLGVAIDALLLSQPIFLRFRPSPWRVDALSSPSQLLCWLYVSLSLQSLELKSPPRSLPKQLRLSPSPFPMLLPAKPKKQQQQMLQSRLPLASRLPYSGLPGGPPGR
jgi:hypothetical protein